MVGFSKSGKNEWRWYPSNCSSLGSCTAGGAYVPAMSDETVIVKEWNYFSCGPSIGESCNREEVAAEELGGAEVHTVHGVTDHFAEDEDQALRMVRISLKIYQTILKEIFRKRLLKNLFMTQTMF